MTNKNTTHIRGLYDVDGWYDAKRYRYHYYVNSNDFHDDEIRYRMRDLRKFNNLKKKYEQKNKTIINRKKASKNIKHRRYQVGVQTGDSLLFDDSEFEKMISLFNEGYNDDLFLFPYLKRRLMIKYFRIWANRFYRFSALKLKKSQLVNNNEIKLKADLSQSALSIDFDFESNNEEIISNHGKEKVIRLQYGHDDNGIKDVTFKVM